ncbi:MAG TPA: M56 family metallopeptidase, partial [Candidatus Eisenbacteria bacterium]|nr:M56 family metallopeptidase [Candidatus Eisenbacteria bacterium]
MIPADPGWAAVTLAAWLLTYAFHSTLLLGSVALIGRWRKLPASLEQTLWKTALLGSLITATAAIAGLDGGTLGVRIHLAPAAPTPSLLPSGLFGAATPASDAELPAPRTWIVLSVWALLGGLGLIRLFAAGRQLKANLGSRRLLISGPERAMLETLLASAGMGRPIRLTVSKHLGSPIAIGNDEICLPERALIELRDEEVRSALAHELAHLARRDPAWRSFTAG